MLQVTVPPAFKRIFANERNCTHSIQAFVNNDYGLICSENIDPQNDVLEELASHQHAFGGRESFDYQGNMNGAFSGHRSSFSG